MNDLTATTKIITVLKNLVYIPLLWVGLPVEAYGILLILMVIDVITGMTASYVIRGRHSITSHLFRVGIASKLIVMSAPFVLALVAKGVGMDLGFFAGGAVSFFILAEAYSIFANYRSIKLKKYVKEFDAVAWVLEKVQNILKKVMMENKNK